MKKIIEKMHKETCNPELKEASKLNGNETFKQLKDIYSKCLDIQGIAILNDMRIR